MRAENDPRNASSPAASDPAMPPIRPTVAAMTYPSTEESAEIRLLRASKRTDWLKNVLDKGSATIVTNGHTYEVDRPKVIPMAEATACFRPGEQRMHRQFHVDSALQVRQRMKAHG